MAIVEMKKLLLIGLESERQPILEYLQDMGNVEITDMDEDSEEFMDIEHSADTEYIDKLVNQLAETEFAIEILNRLGKIERKLLEPPTEVTVRALRDRIRNKDEMLAIVEECRDIDRRLNEIDVRVKRIGETIPQYQAWIGLDIPVDRIEDTKTSKVLIGSVERNKAQAFEEKVKSDIELMYIEDVGSSRDTTNYVVIYHRDIQEEAESILREYGFINATFSGIKGIPKDIIKSLNAEIRLMAEQRKQMLERIAALASNIGELELFYDALTVELDRAKAALRLGESDRTFFLRGWVPSKESDKLKEGLSKVTEYHYLEFEDPAEGEDFPVALDNPPIIEPFEVVTDLYSTPNPHELDPNIYMAPFYFMFFGMMVGDACYGIIMAVVCAYVTKKLKWQGDTKKLGYLIALGGVSTTIWGVLFGSWFGNVGELLGISPILLSPLDQPIEMLVLCFALGIVHLFAGMGVKAYMNIRKGDIWAAVFDQGFWYVLLIGLILMLVGIGGQVGKYMAIAGAVGLILTQGRHERNIFKKITTGVLSLYDLTGFLSDVLSYSRLFALGLTTGIIGTVVNEIGIMFGTSVIGWILAVLVLIVGHIFNILINSIGAYVHASRLQYIEFFGKFFEGGGKAFNPLSIKTKYTQVYDEEVI